jgi:hypothetical protein
LGFDLNRGGDALIEQYRAQCFMMLFIIESGAITYSVETEAVDPLIGLDMIAKSFLEFLLSGEIHVRNQLVG